MTFTKRKVFISFHQQDRHHVDKLITDFGHLFTPKVLGANDNDDFISSNNPEYIMSQIRQRYLEDSSVTLVMVGPCTHSRRYVDWEIKSSLTQGESLPNGLLGIVIPGTQSYQLPDRFIQNWNQQHNSCYGRYHWYPQSQQEFLNFVEDAATARLNRPHLINNPRDMMGYNARCGVHGITH